MKNYIFVVLLFATLSLLSCNNEFDNVIENEIADSIPEVVDNSASTRALSTSTFNWETITTMPTAPGQGTIGVPWVGNGALTALYDLDWVSDRHASDGWVMLGHCFGSEYNYPYFILYNIYRGLLRVYLYVYSNGASAFSSTNMKDGVFLNSSSGYTSTVLNFLGRDLIDVTEIPQSYSQIQPASSFLDSPFMTGQWYMMEYEMAYDPKISTTSYDKHQLGWYLGMMNVQKIAIQGSYEGSINGTFGVSSTSKPSVQNTLSLIGNSYGASVLSGIGSDFIGRHLTPGSSNNDLGITNWLFTNLSADAEKLKQAGSGGFIPILEGLLSGMTGSSPIPIRLDVGVNASFNGTISNQATVTSATLYVPGSKGLSSTSNALAYNKPLGVFNIIGTSRPKIHVTHFSEEYEDVDPWSGYQYTYSVNKLTFPSTVNCSSYIKINPEVQKKASVTIAKQEIVAKSKGVWIPVNTSYMWYEGYAEQGTSYDNPPFIYDELGVRVTIKVKPNNSSNPIYIIKTIKCDEVN